MTTGTSAARPPFTQARELYAELFEAENLETAMWHFSQMKPSEQRFIQGHLLYLLLHGQAVTNLNLRDIRVRMSELENDLQEDEEEGEEPPFEENSGPETALRNGSEAEEEGGDDEADEPDGGSDGAERETGLPPQLQAAVGALEEALTYDREGNAAVAQEAR